MEDSGELVVTDIGRGRNILMTWRFWGKPFEYFLSFFMQKSPTDVSTPTRDK